MDNYLTSQDQQALAAQQGDPSMATPGMPESQGFSFKKLMAKLASGNQDQTQGAVATPDDPYHQARSQTMGMDKNNPFNQGYNQVRGISQGTSGFINNLKKFPSTVSNLFE
jgi:hypothetical protein